MLFICNLQLYKQHLLCEQNKQSHQSLSLGGHRAFFLSEEGSSSISWLGWQGKLRANQQWEHSSLVHFVVIFARWWSRKRREALICRQTYLRRKMPCMSLLGWWRGALDSSFVPYKNMEDDGRGEKTMVSLWEQTYWIQRRIKKKRQEQHSKQHIYRHVFLPSSLYHFHTKP